MQSCSVHLWAPDRLLLQTLTQNFEDAPQTSPGVASLDLGGTRIWKSFSPSLPLTLRASVGWGSRELCTLFLYSIVDIFDHSKGNTCRDPSSSNTLSTTQTVLIESDKAKMQLGDTFALTERDWLPVVCTCAGFSFSASGCCCFHLCGGRFRLQPHVWVLAFLGLSPTTLLPENWPSERGWRLSPGINLCRKDTECGRFTCWIYCLNKPSMTLLDFNLKPKEEAAPPLLPIFALEADRDRILLRVERGNSPLDWTWNGFYTEAQQEVDSHQVFSTFVDLTFLANPHRVEKTNHPWNVTISRLRLWTTLKIR